MKRLNRGLTESQFGFLLILPTLLLLGIMLLYPTINAIQMSLTDMSVMKPETKFVGLNNYFQMFSRPEFMNVLKNTVTMVFFGTLAPFIVGFAWAIVLEHKFQGSEFLRGLTLVAWIIPGTCIAFIWMFIFNGEYGILNAVLKSLNLIDKNLVLLGNPKTAMFVVILASTWRTFPWFMSYIIGGLKGIPMEQVEAARIDGAGNIRVFLHVVLPGMKNLLTVILILGTISTLQQFDLIWVMTGGGPVGATTTLAVEVYRNAFQSWDMGKAATIGVFWMLAMSVFTYFYMKHTSKEI